MNPTDTENDQLPSELLDQQVQLERPRILIIDDDLEVRSSIARMVEHLGYDSCITHHAEEAHRILQAQKIDLILVDYRMPELTGLDFILMLRNEDSHISVVMMSGYPQSEERIFAEAGRELTILKKPISIWQLKIVVDESLRKTQVRLKG